VGHPTVTKQTDAGFLKKHGSVVEGRKAQGQAKTTVKPKQPTLRLDPHHAAVTQQLSPQSVE
jgi:hypothetical protein